MQFHRTGIGGVVMDGITLTVYQHGIPVQERDADEVIITHRFSKSGEITIRTLPDNEAISAYKIGSLIVSEPLQDAFIIEKLEITETALTASGHTADIALKRRVYEKTEIFTGTAKAILEGLLTPFTGVRALPIEIQADDGLTQTISFQKTGATILDVVQAVCEQTEAGYAVEYDTKNNKIIIKVKKEKENGGVIFSPEYDNLTNCLLQGSIEDFATVAYIAGEGEGQDRAIATAGDTTSTGMSRYEVYVDQRNEKKESTDTSQTYKARLQAKGAEELAKHGFSSAMTGDILQTEQCVYGIDYTLGDIVQVENSEWGISDQYLVAEVEESQTASGYSIAPVFAKKGE